RHLQGSRCAGSDCLHPPCFALSGLPSVRGIEKGVDPKLATRGDARKLDGYGIADRLRRQRCFPERVRRAAIVNYRYPANGMIIGELLGVAVRVERHLKIDCPRDV